MAVLIREHRFHFIQPQSLLLLNFFPVPDHGIGIVKGWLVAKGVESLI